MAKYFDIWDTDSGNSLGTYRTQDEALAIVAVLLDTHGDEYANDLDFGEIDDQDRFRLIASGGKLVQMAHEAVDRAALTGTRSD